MTKFQIPDQPPVERQIANIKSMIDDVVTERHMLQIKHRVQTRLGNKEVCLVIEGDLIKVEAALDQLAEEMQAVTGSDKK